MVVIKDMNVPSGCGVCRFNSYTFSECLAAGKRLSPYRSGYDNYKPRWCPIVGVKEKNKDKNDKANEPENKTEE